MSKHAVKSALRAILGDERLQAGVYLRLSETYLLRDAAVRCFLEGNNGRDAQAIRIRLAELLGKPHPFAE